MKLDGYQLVVEAQTAFWKKAIKDSDKIRKKIAKTKNFKSKPPFILGKMDPWYTEK